MKECVLELRKCPLRRTTWKGSPHWRRFGCSLLNGREVCWAAGPERVSGHPVSRKQASGVQVNRGWRWAPRGRGGPLQSEGLKCRVCGRVSKGLTLWVCTGAERCACLCRGSLIRQQGQEKAKHSTQNQEERLSSSALYRRRANLREPGPWRQSRYLEARLAAERWYRCLDAHPSCYSASPGTFCTHSTLCVSA